MGADDKLYKLLAGDREIPWAYAAEEFLRVKVASGGFYPDDAQEVCKVIVAAAQISDEQKEKAVHQGLLSGMRGLVSGDVGLIGRGERTRGSRLGKSIGTLTGAGAGLLAARKGTRGSRALATALGALGGRTVGDALGSEVDIVKARNRLQGPKQKKAEIEKQAEEKKRVTPFRAALVGAPLGAAAGLAVGLTSPRRFAKNLAKRVAGVRQLATEKGFQALNDLQKMELALSQRPDYIKNMSKQMLQKSRGGLAAHTIGTTAQGAAAGAATGAGAVRAKEHIQERRQGIERVRLGPKEREVLVAKHGPEVLESLGIKKHASLVSRVHQILTKVAQHPGGDAAITSPTVPLPAESPLVNPSPAELHPAIQGQLDQMQQQNEAEFYRTQAEQAKQEAESGKQRVEELIQQINMLNQNSQMQMQQDQQVRQMAEQNAQAAQQDSMMARNESMQSQQQTLALRAAVTQFRQALMNLVAQDPTQAMGPPPVQTGPMPPAPGAPPEAAAGAPAGPPEAAPPVPEGTPPGAPPAAPPPPEVAAPALPAPEPMAPPPPPPAPPLMAPAGGAAPAPAAG